MTRVTPTGLFHPPPDPSACIRLTLPYPISANVYWRTRVMGRGRRAVPNTYVSDEAKAYKTIVDRICRDAGVAPLSGDILIVGDVYRPRKAGDLSNRIKVLEDALISFAFEDDAQVRAIDLERDEDKQRPRVELEIRPWSRRRDALAIDPASVERFCQFDADWQRSLERFREKAKATG